MLLAATAAATVPAAPTSVASRTPVLALADGTLLRLDPVTLKPVGAERLGPSSQAGVAARSPGGGRLALDSRLAQLTIVDLRGLRRLATIELPTVDDTAAVAWPTPQRVLVARQTGRQRPGPVEAAAVDVVDPVAARVISHRRLRWAILDARPAPAGLVLLLQPRSGLGVARLGLAGVDGRVRSVALPGIRAGETTWEGRSFWTVVRDNQPGLAVDRSGGRAFVVGQSTVAEVDLRTLRVRSRGLPLRRPAKSGPPVQGSTREAYWLGRGRLAVWGSDVEGRREQLTGLMLLDLDAWSLRTVDVPEHARFRGAGGGVLAFGSISDRGPHAEDMLGVTAFDAAGRVRFRVLDGERAFVGATAGPYAYVYRRTPRGGKLRSVLDLRTGTVVRTEEHVWRVPEFL